MKKRIEIGLLTIALGGALFAFGDMLIPQENLVFEAQTRPMDFANLVVTDNYKMWALRGFVGVLMELFGTVTLYLLLSKTKVEKMAFWGLILTLAHHATGFAVFAVAYFMFPALGEIILAGQVEAAKFAYLEGGLAILFGSSLVITLVSLAVMAYAIQKSNMLPKFSGWIVLAGFMMIPLPGVIVQVGANLLWGFGYFWMWLHVRKSSSIISENPV